MSDPYTPPAADLDTDILPMELAGRGTRFLAALIDGIISAVLLGSVMAAFGIFDNIQNMGLVQTLTINLVGLVVFACVHGYLLKHYGQTVGKRVLGIKIVALDGSLVDLPNLILKRYLPITLCSAVPFVGPILPLVDVLFIFSGERRCVHDHIAGTKVIKM